MQTVGPETSFKPGLGAMEIACNAIEIAAKQTLCEEAKQTGLEARKLAMESALGRQASKQASRLWKLPWMR